MLDLWLCATISRGNHNHLGTPILYTVHTSPQSARKTGRGESSSASMKERSHILGNI